MVRDERAYARLFVGGAAFAVRVESSTSYLASAVAAERIADFNPDARIVAVLRDPVERAYSHYLNDVREGLESRSFLQAVRAELEAPAAWPAVYVESGRYRDQVGRYVDRFDGRALFLVFEELAAAPERALQTVLEFVGVDPRLVIGPSNEPVNAYSRARSRPSRALLGSAAVRGLARSIVPPAARGLVRRLVVAPAAKPPMDEEARRLLVATYRHDVEALEGLLDRSLPWLDAGTPRRG